MPSLKYLNVRLKIFFLINHFELFAHSGLNKKADNGAYAPGHNSFFTSRDGTETWIVYHANSTAGLGCSDARNPRMQRFTWNADGTPYFGEPVKINSPIKKPAGE